MTNNKVLLTIAFVALMALSAMADMNQFAEFQRTYKKFYSSDDFLHRYSVFSQNLQRAAEMNQRNAADLARDETHESAGADAAVFGVTQFSDLTPEEFASQYLVANGVIDQAIEEMEQDKDEKHKSPHDHDNDKDTRAPIPTSFDWRNNNRSVLTPVYNQGSCGSCWAFAAAENLESMWALAGNPLLSLSAQQMVDCDRNNNGCGGGWPTRAYSYIKTAGGLQTRASYPYTGRKGTCRFSRSQIGARLTNWVYATQNRNEAAMATFVATKGPISVCLDATIWHSYRSGVITSSSGCGSNLNHCVMVTGYGVTSSGMKYWIVRNQWGTGFGDKGYLKIQRGANVCGIASAATSVVV